MSDHSDDDEAGNLSEFKEEEEESGGCCKTILRFFFSFVGLFILLAVWTLAGAYYFYIEENYLEEHRFRIMNESAIDVDNAKDYIRERLDYVIFDRHGSFDNCTVFTDDVFYVPHRWQYGDSCLDKNNAAMKNSRFCKCLWLYKKRFEAEAEMNIRRMTAFIVQVSGDVGYNLDPDTMLPLWNWDWTFTNALLFTMTTLTLIGYGHIAPTTVDLKLKLIIYVLVGLPLTMVFLANIGNIMANFITYVYSRMCCRWCRVRRKKAEEEDECNPNLDLEKSTASFVPESVPVKKEDVGDEPYMPTDDVLVPITITLCIMAAYCVFGAVIYISWEGWSLMDACYFTFITLTTIGFGDFVPGSSFASSDESDVSLILKMIFTTFYCLFGLALIAMGISLMQESLEQKAGWFAESSGMNGEFADMDRYILTKHYNIKETPADKTGNKLNYNGSDDDSDNSDFDNIEELKSVHGDVQEDSLIDIE